MLKKTAMKRFIYALLLVLSVGLFSSCNKEGGTGSSSLIGTWDLVEEGIELNGSYIKSSSTSSAYWVFTETTFTIHSSEDLMNNIPIEYKYSNGNITVSGMPLYKVMSLSKTELKVKINALSSDGAYPVLTFKKR